MVVNFFDFLPKGLPHHEAQCLLEIDFGPLCLLGRGLSWTCARLTVGASVLGRLVSWPNLFVLAPLRSEFFSESSHPPTPSTRLMACTFPKREGDAQEVLGLEESAA